MPSPGRIRSFLLAGIMMGFRNWSWILSDEGLGLGPHPRPRLAVAGLETIDRGRPFQGEADVVEPRQQAMLAEGVDVEMQAAAGPAGGLPLLPINGHPPAW